VLPSGPEALCGTLTRRPMARRFWKGERLSWSLQSGCTSLRGAHEQRGAFWSVSGSLPAAKELQQLGAGRGSPSRLVAFATPTNGRAAPQLLCRIIRLTVCVILQMLRLSPLTNTALRHSPLLLPASSAVFAGRARLLHTSHPLSLDTDRPQPPTPSYPPPSISQATRRRIDTSNNGPSASPADPIPLMTPPPVEARLTKRKITSVNELPERFGKNQIIAVPDQVKKELEEVMRVFKAPVRFAFAYGSGVFRQSGYTSAVRLLPALARCSSRLGEVS
jgi:hypothetical protein